MVWAAFLLDFLFGFSITFGCTYYIPLKRYFLDNKGALKSRMSKSKLFEEKPGALAAYWLVDDSGKEDVYVYEGKRTGRQEHRFLHRASRHVRDVKQAALWHTRVYQYVEAAESITRAQKAFMTIELDHGKKFVYDAFMEFEHLREPLRRLLVLSQVHCPVLDDARLNVLQSIQHSFASTEVALGELEVGKKYFYFKGEEKQYVPFVPTLPYAGNEADG